MTSNSNSWLGLWGCSCRDSSLKCKEFTTPIYTHRFPDVRNRVVWSRRSHADLESFFVSFVFFHIFPISSSFRDELGPTLCWTKVEFPIMFCISGIILSLIAEFIALLIWVCMKSIILSISLDILAFITPDKVLIDSISLPSPIGSFLLSMSLISFSWDEFSLFRKDWKSCCLSGALMRLSNSLSIQLEFPSPNIMSMFP